MSCPRRTPCRLCKQKYETKRHEDRPVTDLWETKLPAGSKSDLGPAYHGSRIETFVKEE